MGQVFEYVRSCMQENSQYMHYKLLFQWPKIYGPVYRLFLGQIPYVVVTGTPLLRHHSTNGIVRVLQLTFKYEALNWKGHGHDDFQKQIMQFHVA